MSGKKIIKDSIFRDETCKGTDASRKLLRTPLSNNYYQFSFSYWQIVDDIGLETWWHEYSSGRL